jgi:predicted Fe-Mo cluster-binding NifX family protein
MKVVVPLSEQASLNSAVCEHFGSAPFFAVADTEAGSFDIISNMAMNHEHGQCTPADLFSGNGVEAVLCNGIGARAASKLQMLGIDVYLAADAPTLEDALARFSNGTLARMTVEQSCQGHDCH